ncbi:MAG: sigma-70 family RNA polymerase sigma factor, partial [Planctomycetota bacterium]|nr:sigma-70 family RNA polymerase sigma factor [Planctomycetota bacterium]
QDADAADLMQDVFRSVASAVGRLDYDPARGTFRSWLFTITRNKLNTFLDRRRRQPVGTGDTSMHERLEGQLPQFDENSWETEYQQRVFDWAIEQVKPNFGETVWQAFWQTAVEGKGAQETATKLGMSVGAVYVAKSRVLAQIREQVQGIDNE